MSGVEELLLLYIYIKLYTTEYIIYKTCDQNHQIQTHSSDQLHYR